MKTLAFIIALIIVAVGLLGVGRPVVLLWLASRSMGPVQLYAVAAFRVAFGLLLLYVAPRSRAPSPRSMSTWLDSVTRRATRRLNRSRNWTTSLRGSCAAAITW